MALDIGKWLRERVLHLPARMNSLSDVVGTDRADLLKELAKPLVEDVLDDALGFVGSGLGGAVVLANRTVRSLTTKTERVLGRAISDQLRQEMEDALGQAIRSVENSPEAIRAAIEAGIWKALKL